ncbi:hypothetical protein X975_14756, partial [Stegodyphus mimosarum]
MAKAIFYGTIFFFLLGFLSTVRGDILDNCSCLKSHNESLSIGREVDLRIHCARSAEALACLEKCVNAPMEKFVTSLILGGLKQMISELCRPGSSLGKRYTKSAKCLRKENQSFKVCSRLLSKDSLSTSHHNERPLREAICCAINEAEDCIFGEVHKACGSSAAELVIELLNKALYSIKRIICSGSISCTHDSKLFLSNPDGGTINDGSEIPQLEDNGINEAVWIPH